MTTTSISSSPEMRAKSVAPTFEWSVATTTRRARSMTAALTAASLRLPTLMPSSEKPLTPRKATLNAKRWRFSSASGPTTEPRPSELTAEEDAVDAGHVRERGGDASVLVRTDRRSRRLSGERLGNGIDGRAAVEEHRVAVAQQVETGRGDRLLARPVRRLPAGELAVDDRMQGERAAVGALEHPALLQRAEVLADGRLGDAELLRELADARAAAVITTSAMRAWRSSAKTVPLVRRRGHGRGS